MAATAEKTEKLDLGLQNSGRKLLASHFLRAEYSRPDFRVVLKDNNTTLDDLLRPSYWANVGGLLKAHTYPFAMIEVVWGDGSRYVRLICIQADRLWAKVKVLEDINLAADTAGQTVESAAAEAEEAAEFKIEYKGPSLRYCVIRQSDKENIQANLADKAAAQKWLDDHLKALKA